ncbi:MAG: hypothetical protein ABEH66_05855 [Halobacteriales archaeon]
MNLESFLSDVDSPSRQLVVFTQSAPDTIQSMLEEAFLGQSVEVVDDGFPDTEGDTIVSAS